MINKLRKKTTGTFPFIQSFVKILPAIVLALFLANCQWGPKEKELVIPESKISPEAFYEGVTFDMKQIKVLEILPSESYVYLNVSNDDQKFWIATRPGDLHVDSTYYYREALLKTDFESKQLNRVFDSIYLVTALIPEHHVEAQKTH